MNRRTRPSHRRTSTAVAERWWAAPLPPHRRPSVAARGPSSKTCIRRSSFVRDRCRSTEPETPARFWRGHPGATASPANRPSGLLRSARRSGGEVYRPHLAGVAPGHRPPVDLERVRLDAIASIHQLGHAPTGAVDLERRRLRVGVARDPAGRRIGFHNRVTDAGGGIAAAAGRADFVGRKSRERAPRVEVWFFTYTVMTAACLAAVTAHVVRALLLVGDAPTCEPERTQTEDRDGAGVRASRPEPIGPRATLQAPNVSLCPGGRYVLLVHPSPRGLRDDRLAATGAAIPSHPVAPEPTPPATIAASAIDGLRQARRAEGSPERPARGHAGSPLYLLGPLADSRSR
jgi:hypothetical protein